MDKLENESGQSREEFRHDTVQFIYDNFSDNEIELILKAFHQDLGREASLFCEICNKA